MEPGQDSLGKVYPSIGNMWQEEVKNKEVWYERANSYWSQQGSDMNGIMGGLPEIHPKDIEGSQQFLNRTNKKIPFMRQKALDCGCGIGRVTKYFLANEFQNVDLVDQCENYVRQARSDLGEGRFRYWVQGLQDFEPGAQEYDVIWIQWVLSHLTDSDLESFFDRISRGVKETGVIIIKENVKKKGFIVHKDDFSVTRSEVLLKEIILKKFRIVEEQFQTGFPADLFKVKMFACVPK